MTTSTKARRNVKRNLSASRPVGNGTVALKMTIQTGNKVETFGYYATPIAADFGSGFRMEKFGTEQEEGEPASYDVLIDAANGFHSCECKGFLRWHHCKHIEATLAALKAGKIQALPMEQETVLLTAEPPQPMPIQTAKAWCEHCKDDPAVCCSHCSI